MANFSKECICCGNVEFSPHLKALKKCVDCGHVCWDSFISPEQASSLYSKNYFMGEEYSNYVEEESIHRLNFADRIRSIDKLIKIKDSNLLEIGSAYGFFLSEAKAKFKSVKGIDITEEGVRYAQKHLKHDVTLGDYLDTPFAEESLDIVVMWDTIEHLPQPNNFIKKIHMELKKGAYFVFTTGDISSLNAKLRKDSWRLIHPPTHIHYFTKKSAIRILKENGFSNIKIEHVGFSRSIDNILYNIFVLRIPSLRIIYTVANLLRLTRFKLYLNLYDIMLVSAQKT